MDRTQFYERGNRRTGLTIFPSQERALDRILADVSQKSPAQLVLLIAKSGQIVSAHGERGQLDLIALGSLVAGDLAASQEIARLSGEYQDFQMVLREGQRSYLFLADAGQDLALFVQLGVDVPLGWARMIIQAAARRLAEIMAAPPEEVHIEELQLDTTNLPDLFSEALDSIVGG